MVKNTVIAGNYKGKRVVWDKGDIGIEASFSTTVPLSTKTVKSYSLVDSEDATKRFNLGGAIVGGALLGDVGVLAGGLSNKQKRNLYVAVEFFDGKRSLLSIDDRFYKLLLKAMFDAPSDDRVKPVKKVKDPALRKLKWKSVGIFFVIFIVLYIAVCLLYPTDSDGTLQVPDWIPIITVCVAVAGAVVFYQTRKRRRKVVLK